MDYEILIFQGATACIPALVVYFTIIMILDFIRTCLFSN